MKLRESLVVGTAAVVTLAGCTSDKEMSADTHSSHPNKNSSLHFIADGNQSDVYHAINCASTDPSERATAQTLPMPGANASVLITLGETNDPVYEGRSKSGKLLGGVTVRATAGQDEIAFSDGYTTWFTPEDVAMSQKPYVKMLQVGGYALVFALREAPDAIGTGAPAPEIDLSCVDTSPNTASL